MLHYLAAVSIFSGMVVYYSSDGIDGGILSWGHFMVLGVLILLNIFTVTIISIDAGSGKVL